VILLVQVSRSFGSSACLGSVVFQRPLDAAIRTKRSAMHLDSWQPEESANQLSPPANQIRGHSEAHKDTVVRAANTIAHVGLSRSILQRSEALNSFQRLSQ